MATIGLYDIDFNHGKNFSLSIPLMKAYNKLIEQGHQIIMMSPYEKTGRYNKIFYFKENPNLPIPQKLIINHDKGSFIGYGFYGKNDLAESTKEYSPDFTPYDLCNLRIKNKTLYKSIKSNSLIDWREKDFTGARAGVGITYVNDRDFLKEDDWESLFQHYDNNIEFVHSIKPINYEQAISFLNLYQGNSSRIIVPYTTDKEKLLEYLSYKNVCFAASSIEEKFLLALAAKTLCEEPILFSNFTSENELEKDINAWSKSKLRISFKDFIGNRFDDNKYLKFRYRILLKQDPKKITYNELKADYLTS